MPLRSHPLESSFSRLEKFRLYETATFYYLVGFDNQETMFRLLKINRLIQRPKSLAEIVREDDLVYTAADIAEILKMIDEGNKTSGGLVKICSAYGIVGFVRFLDCFYLTLITQRKEVGCIAGSFVYSIKATEMFPVRPRDEPETNAFRSLWKKLNKKLSQSSVEIAENRYMGLFQFIDMTKDFFFSYTYDLTRSLQYNYMHAAANKSINKQNPVNAQEQIATAPQDIFQWNHYQIHELQEILGPVGSSHWILPLIHGSYQQKRFSLFGKCLDVIMIARRSRHYAGTRYLKRGINVHGKAANDCEVEQVTQHDDSYRSHYCSYLQMRASIPTYWYQETSVTMPKPPILVNRVDPDYRATEEHVADLFRRYSAPIIALDLVKQHEKRPRESLVGGMFRQAIEVVNESLPVAHKVRYIALDYSRITSIAKGKSKGSKGVGPGAGVGHEWKNLVENTLTADSPVGGDPAVPGTAAHAAAVTRDSPLMFPGGSFSAKSGGLSDPTGGLGSPAGMADDGAVVGSAPAQAQQPRWHSTDVRIDVLRELEDVATMTIAETAFFCNTGDYLDRVRILPTAKLAKVKAVGHLEQRGVLRTNCIDCLDRTNGAQFAVAMKFLSVSLQALGICSAGQGLEPTNQMLVSLMEMYGEMGDKIALQYGGSEAHRKVPGGQVASSAKQSELLTSIKRYYSNAFTDMVKQDAMNVFLGCFQPTDNATPLWDLESDYSLHNQSLCPPPPLVNKVLFEKIYLDSHALSLPVVRQLIESSIKKALTDAHHERVALVPVDSKKRLKKVLQSEDLIIRTDKIEDVISYLRHLGIPEIDRERLLRGYFIRNAAALQRELEEASSTGEEATTPPAGAATGDHAVVGKGSSPQLPSRIHLKIAIRNIGRLEKRKFLRAVASKRVSNIATVWWKSALLEYEESLYGVSQEGQVIAAARFVPKPVQKPPSYFNRAYTPDQLSEFDVLLSLDFFSPIDVARDVADTGRFSPLRPVDAPIRAKAPVADHGALAAAAAGLARKFDREYLHGSHRSKDSYAAAHMYDEYPSGVASSNSTALSAITGAALPTVSDPYTGASANSNPDTSFADVADPVTANAGFQITRYMRKLVGGFLRKEDSTAAPTTTGKTQHKAREGKREWNWYHHMINFHEHRVSRKTSSLYTRYVTVSQNPLLLMEKMGNQRIAEEEYFLLLRDINIDVDNVSGMEHLSIEGYVSSEINQGVFQGMPQRESAVAAYAFLHTALVQVEAELEDPAAGLEGAARDPFAPNPVARGGTTRRRAHTTAPSTFEGGGGAHHRAASDGTTAGHHISDPRLLLRMALQKNPGLDAHLERCLARVDHVRGLDREFRRMIGDYIAQQAAYAKEMSYGHLSTRLSANTTEHSILEYAMQYDHRALAQDLENIDFLARCNPAYESFQELINLRQTLAPVQSEVRESKRQLLRERQQQQEAEEAAARVARAEDDTGSESSVSEQLGLGGHIPSLREDLHKDYSLDMYGRPFPYVDNIGLTGVQNPPGQPQLFYQMDSDLYVRSTNPFMQLNEVAVNSLSHALYAF